MNNQLTWTSVNYIDVQPNEYIEYKWYIYKKLWKVEKIDKPFPYGNITTTLDVQENRYKVTQ